ncbi:MAG: hypothetical protein WBC63_05665 [Candidatus Bipolaricaulia bacterium]
MNRSRIVGAYLLAGVLLLSLSLSAANLDTITVNYEVQAINELAISVAAVTLTIDSATAGSEPDDVTDNSTATYALTTNAATDAKKITAAIDTDMPSNVSLYLTLGAPTGGTSPGELLISATPADVVTAIETVAESTLSMTFRLSATVAAGVVASASKTLTLTLTDS